MIVLIIFIWLQDSLSKRVLLWGENLLFNPFETLTQTNPNAKYYSGVLFLKNEQTSKSSKIVGGNTHTNKTNKLSDLSEKFHKIKEKDVFNPN